MTGPPISSSPGGYGGNPILAFTVSYFYPKT